MLIEHRVQPGDIWRATQTKDIAIRDWVKLAVTRARASGAPAVFWLDEARSHDAALIAKVKTYLAEHDTDGLTIEILAPARGDPVLARPAAQGRGHDLGDRQRAARLQHRPVPDPRGRHVGEDAEHRSAAGRRRTVRDRRGRIGARSTSSSSSQQNYLRWDSLGEFFALAASLEHLANFTGNVKAQVLADTLDAATGTFLENDKSPGRALGTIDNRGSHFYLALYWAQELASQQADPELAAIFAPVAEALAAQEQQIVAELLAVQGSPVDIGGYYRPDSSSSRP